MPPMLNPSFAKPIARILLRRILRKPCPPTVPRSGKEGAAQNCYFVYVKNNVEQFFLAKEINGRALLGLASNERDF